MCQCLIAHESGRNIGVLYVKEQKLRPHAFDHRDRVVKIRADPECGDLTNRTTSHKVLPRVCDCVTMWSTRNKETLLPEEFDGVLLGPLSGSNAS